MKKILLIMITFLIFFNLSFSQWVDISNGLYNNTKIDVITFNGSQIFIGTQAKQGIYYSTDNGDHWISKGLKISLISSIKIYEKIIYASTWQGVYVSTDNGNSWNQKNNGLTKQIVKTLALCGSTIFAGTWIMNTSSGGMFRSTDSCGSWTENNAGLSNTEINYLYVKDSILFAATGSGGMCRSTNFGDNWVPINNGLKGYNSFSSINSYKNNLYVGTYGSIFLSTNNGDLWVAKNQGLKNLHVISLACLDNNIFAGTNNGGILLSTDNGDSWRTINNGLIDSNLYIYSLEINGNYIFAGTYNGVRRAKLSDFGITGISESQSVESCLKISPNPASDFIEIDVGKNGGSLGEIGIYDVFGQKVTTPALRATPPYERGEKLKIDVSCLTPGLYFVRIGAEVQKFIKL